MNLEIIQEKLILISSSRKKDFFSFPLLTAGILTIFFILLFIPAKEILAGCNSWYGGGGCNPSYCGKTDGCDYNMSSWCCWNNAGRKCDCDEECPDDYWADEYRCSGNMSQQKWVDMYCSGGTWCSTAAAYCYYSTSWQNRTDCGGDYWGNSYTCSGTMRQRWYVSRGCYGAGTCYNNGYWENWSECGASDWTSNYRCSGNVLERQYMSRGCSGSSCYGPTYPWYEWENCAASGKICSSNQCVVPPDTTPPSFSYFYASPTSWTNGNPIWYYSATDSGSGMRSTNRYYRFLDGAGRGYTMDTSYQPSLSSGSHYVSVNAYDNAGNARGSGNVYAYVDKTDPSGAFSVNKTSFAPNETITLTLTASDSHSGINVLQAYYKGSWHNQSCGGASSCTKTWSFSESSFGDYTYTGNIYDVAGNASYSSPSVITISIADATPPTFTSFYVSPTSWTNGNPTWSWSATDSGSGMRSTNRYYIFLDGAGQGYTMSTSYTPSLSSGSHYVSINAYDNAGNAVGSGNVYAYVDKTDPSSSLSVNKTSVDPGETITLTISASDSHSGINVLQAYYQGSWHNQSCGGASSCTKTWSFSESSFGSYTYTGNTYDQAGNAAYTSPSTVTVSIADEVPPSAPIMSPASRSWANTDASVTVTYSDPSGIGNARYCWTAATSCNPGTWGLLGYFTNGTAISQNDDGAWTLCTRATDNAGNWSNVHCSGGGAYKVDKTNPNTPTINSPASGSSQSADFSVSVSGDLDPGGSGVAACYYHVKDEVTGTFTKSWATRTCNSSFTVTVGSGKDCPSVGNCRVYAFSKDNATNTGSYFSRSFDIKTPCLGTIALSLDKDTAYANESVATTISGLNGCNGLTIEIIDHETYSYQFSASCIASGSGCTTTIAAPYFGATLKLDWNIHARIDKNQDGDFADAGEDSNQEKLSVVYSSILCDIGSGCGYLGFTGSPSRFDNWVGMIGGTPGGTTSPPASWFVSSSRLKSSCNQGGIKCQLIGAPSANNGDTCNLVDACQKSGPTAESAFYPYPRSGKWDVSQNQCVLCQAGTFFQEKKIMDATQKCFDVGDGYNCLNPPIWTNLACATAVDNSKCESACGAPSGCDEKAINVPWTEGSTTYKCDSSCAKVVVDNTPPISTIKETDPNSAVPSGNWFKQSFKVRIEDTDDQGVTGLTCRYSLWACDKMGVINCEETDPKKTNVSRSCNAWIDISSADCYKEGLYTCKLEVYAIDSNNNQGTKVQKWYNMDFTGPSITR